MILLLVNESIEVNSVDPDQNYLTGSTLSKRLLKHFSRRQKQTTFAVIDALRAKSIFLMYCIESKAFNLPSSRPNKTEISLLSS